ARSTAESSNVAIAGSVDFMSFTNDAESTVKSGALINQDKDWQDAALNPHENQAEEREDKKGEQTVSVEASNYMELINLAGIFDFELPSGSITPTDPKFDPKLSISPVASEGEKGGVGGAIFLMFIHNTTHSTVESGVHIYSGADGGFNMKADEAIFNI